MDSTASDCANFHARACSLPPFPTYALISMLFNLQSPCSTTIKMPNKREGTGSNHNVLTRRIRTEFASRGILCNVEERDMEGQSFDDEIFGVWRGQNLKDEALHQVNKHWPIRFDVVFEPLTIVLECSYTLDILSQFYLKSGKNLHLCLRLYIT